jgi:putative SOS response-associated peptidase YedK
MERYNIAPTQLDVFVRPRNEDRELVASRWGLVPRWAKDRSIASKTFNARAETLHERASFKNLIASHRCIVPISGFYEWQREGKKRQPLYIHRADEEPIALAGLWTEWPDPESGELLTTHTVITCAPNAAIAPIHNRMPVILDGDGLDAWLDPGIEKPADVLPLLVPCPDDLLSAYPVATLVNSARNEGPALIQPLA